MRNTDEHTQCARLAGTDNRQTGGAHLWLDRHLLGGASRLDRHSGLKRDSGGGVSACLRSLHGA